MTDQMKTPDTGLPARKPAGPRRRRGRKIRWRWALPGAVIATLLLLFAGDLHRFGETVLRYGARAGPALALEWRVRRTVLPALDRHDPDEALRALDALGVEARRFEDRVLPLRLQALLAKDDIEAALGVHALATSSGMLGDPELAEALDGVLRPHLEASRAERRSTDIRFEDVTDEAGVAFEHAQRGPSGLRALYQAMGSGLGLLDLDGDGALDLLYLGGNDDPAEDAAGNRLFRNRGDGSFEDVTDGSGLADSGFSYGVAAADLTGDGLPEIYVTALGPNRLFLNRGGMRFEDVTASTGTAGSGGASTGAAFADVDGDGDLDLYVAQWVKEARRSAGRLVELIFSERSRLALFAPHMYAPDENQLFENLGGLRFADATASAGVADPEGRGLGVVFTDFDGDARPDLFVANDVSPNRFFRNQGDGRFEDASAATRTLDARAGMGIAVSDWNEDGALDLFYTNFRTEYNALLVNELREGYFSEQTHRHGLADGSLGVTSWGVVAADLDHDGDLDLATVNGHPTPFDPNASAFRGDAAEASRCLAEAPLLYDRRGDRFEEVSAGTGAFGAWRGVGRGLVAGDIDRDGRLDLAVSSNNGPGRLFRNRSGASESRHWLAIRLRGHAENRLAVGALVRVEVGGRTQTQVVLSGGSYLSQPPFELHFGLGDASRADRILVRWPDGREQQLTDVAPDRVLTIDALHPGPGQSVR